MNLKKPWKVVAAQAALLWPSLVLAQGFNQQVGFAGVQSNNLVGAVISIVNAFLVFAALLAAIFIIIGGVRYIVSGGDESGQETAKNTILYAIIGLVVIGISAAIVNFVVSAVNA